MKDIVYAFKHITFSKAFFRLEHISIYKGHFFADKSFKILDFIYVLSRLSSSIDNGRRNLSENHLS